MSANLEKLLADMLEEQRRISLYTLTLERDRLYASLFQTGLGTYIMVANEFSLAAGATTTIIQPVPPGFVFLNGGSGVWHTSLPWWCSYTLWLDTTPPAIPIATATRMPETLSTPDFKGIFAVRAFLLHQVTNTHATQHAYGMIQNAFLIVSTETWEMIKAVYLDSIVADVRKKAHEVSGIQR